MDINGYSSIAELNSKEIFKKSYKTLVCFNNISFLINQINIVGPLTYTKNGQTTIYGVVSAGDCKLGTLFGAVSAPKVWEWIKNICDEYCEE